MRLIAICAAGLLLFANVPVQAATERPFPLVSVTGEGTISAVPDIALVSAGIVSEGKTSREAAEANAKAMTAVIAAAKQAGIAEKDIGTSRYNVSPVYASGSSNRENSPRITGYRAQNMVQLKVRDIAKVGDIIDAVTGAGANNIQGVGFEVSNADTLLDKARLAAFADAKRKAELYAKEAKAQLGRVIVIAEQGTELPRPMMARAAPGSYSGSAPATPVAPGEEQIKVQLNVSFELSQ
ncbi:26 kDa periplasmic immunogenic protein precursor [Variibacter gotjawalensis]|uniref:26 kDa periplasmic immunogenic protein n=1 Tax=Variibacter gotjawalensis TaxID=1333996 RepID=A0A0S3PRU7_9BRAD|nr:SIMPL domain-containing protein [Variibacter gotjawalensis]NIK48927.1 hypothetical protein [Variibacter gotjawalensis]RZS50783.1 hypothetical protein EV661_3254 [Variibacter gotjawalensis]BAT58617.1 26 kDa periplasmic immunogenic protein precursor [Variibacter gotjawalensis]